MILDVSSITAHEEVAMSAVESQIPVGTWTADPSHSAVEFAVRHMAITTVKGVFREFEAVLEGGESPSLSGVIRTASVDTHDSDRDAHLRAPDFFDADRHPEATVVATSVEDGQIVAELTLRGVKDEIVLAAEFTGPATDPWGNARIGLELDGEIDRTRFGLDWNAPLPGGGFLLPDTVKLHASFSFVEQA
jgi:polyisoprenoid-binding protein YceI